MAELTRRNFVVGSGLTLAAGAGVLASEGATCAVAEEQAEVAEVSEGHVYQVITDELNPQDYDYRQNSGDLSHVL